MHINGDQTFPLLTLSVTLFWFFSKISFNNTLNWRKEETRIMAKRLAIWGGWHISGGQFTLKQSEYYSYFKSVVSL